MNTKEIPGCVFEGDVPFCIADENTGLCVDCKIKLSGVYSIRVSDPATVYKKLTGNVSSAVRSGILSKMLNAEMYNLSAATAGEMDMKGMRPSQLPEMIPGLEKAVIGGFNGRLREKWGVEIVSFAFEAITLSSAYDYSMIASLQKIAVYRDPSMAAAGLADAARTALTEAAANTGGGGAVWAVKFPEPASAPALAFRRCSCGAEASGRFCTECGRKLPGEWKCACGSVNTGRFCTECGLKVPEEWSCLCGKVNKGRYCTECGKEKPGGV